jgi:16S rRNA (uracil1498-N3)-methyltransferase
MNSIRALPRIFLPGVEMHCPFEIPKAEHDKLHNVLRLRSGAEIGVMPNDGTFWVCRMDGKIGVPIVQHRPDTEPSIFITVAQALPKGDKLDDIIKSCTEIGASRFVLFTGARSVVKWDEKKVEEKMRRIRALARESAELAFRMRIPTVEFRSDLNEVLTKESGIIALSEQESVTATIQELGANVCLVVGPEGGWAPREVEAMRPFAVTLGPRVLRTEHAGFAAIAKLLVP